MSDQTTPAPAGAPLTRIPGIKAAHAIITPTCRQNRSDLGAWSEASQRLAIAYVDSLPHNAESRFHVVLTVERSEPVSPPPPAEPTPAAGEPCAHCEATEARAEANARELMAQRDEAERQLDALRERDRPLSERGDRYCVINTMRSQVEAPAAGGQAEPDPAVDLFEHVTALYVIACQQPQGGPLRKRLSELVREFDRVGERLSAGVWNAHREPEPASPAPPAEATVTEEQNWRRTAPKDHEAARVHHGWWYKPADWELVIHARGEKATASVWRNGTWHTFDRKGTGGENGREATVEDAKREAEAALIRQGWGRELQQRRAREK